MARYRLESNGWEIYDSQKNKYIMVDGNNPDYQEFVNWIHSGNEPDPPLPLPHESNEDKVKTKKLLRVLKSIRQWVLSKDSTANIPNLD